MDIPKDCEIHKFKCYCGKEIDTVWKKPEYGGGLLRGDYILFGELFFHIQCLEEYIETNPVD